jgi:hypothetical protein
MDLTVAKQMNLAFIIVCVSHKAQNGDYETLIPNLWNRLWHQASAVTGMMTVHL